MPKKSVQKKSWKSVQSKRQLKKTTKLAVLVLVFVLGLLVLGQIVNFGRMFFNPWNLNQIKINKNYKWDGKYNLNLIIKAKSTAVLSLNPIDKTATVIHFPDNTLVETAFGFGNWQIRSVYDLDGSNTNGLKMLEQTMANNLGIPIDGMLEFKGSLENLTPQEAVSRLHQGLTGISDIKDIKTDLTLLELLRLEWGLSQIRFDKIKNIDLNEVNVLDEKRMNDGTPVFIADPVRMDQTLNFTDPSIQKEHATVAVFNATNYPQLAQKAARVITNMGGNVIITANSENSYAKTQVIGEKGVTLTRLIEVFDLGCGKDPKCVKICQPGTADKQPAGCVSDPDVEDSRAQINIVLGEDFYKQQ